MFRRSVLLLLLIISVFHFNCSVITKVYSGIQMFRRIVLLLLLIISVFHFTAQLSRRLSGAFMEVDIELKGKRKKVNWKNK